MLTIPQTVRAGEDITIDRYYSVAVAALFLYDYLLTLPDEIQYVWKGKKTWLFYLFLINRYLPFISQIWGITVQSIISEETFFVRSLCRESTIIKALTFVISTLVAQVIIGTRAYALSESSRKLLMALLSVEAIYVVFAILLIHTIITAVGPAPTAPFEALRLCLNDPGAVVGFLCVAAVLAFDILAITSIVVQVFRLSRETSTLGRTLRTIFRDVTIYLLVIFVSHLWLVVSVKTARPELKILPAIGLEVMIPIMISRLTLALKKAFGKDSSWNNDLFTSKSFVPRVPTPNNTRDDTVRSSVDPEAARA